MPRLLTVCLLLSLPFLLAVSLAARPADEALAGAVVDPNHNPLPRVTVRLLDTAGTELARTLTDSDGRFRFSGLGSRSYTIEASLTGFETMTIATTPGREIEIVLSVAPVREEVVVTATRTEAPTDQVGASTRVFTAGEIARRQSVQASDLLRAMAGSAVLRSGGYGTITSLFIRGGESNYNKVMLDGIPLNGPGGEFFFDNLSLENVERVEVVRGPQSALFGSDAVASVVQLFTRPGRAETDRPHFFAAFEGGNQDTWRARGGVTGQIGRFDYSTQWARFASDNREPNSAFHNTTLSGNFGFVLNDTTSLRAVLRGELGRVGTPDLTAFEPPDLTAFSRRRTGLASVSLRNRTTSFWEQRLTYGFNQARQVDRDLLADKLFDFLFDALDNQRRHHLSYQSDWRLGSIDRRAGEHLLTFAFEWEGERGFFGDRLDPANVATARRDNFGWVFQHQAIWGRFFLTNGLRLEQNGSFGFAAVPRVWAAYFLRQTPGPLGATKLKFNFGLGIKEPTFVDSFSRNPGFRGNPDLRAERSRSFDFGVEQRFWYDRAKLEVNLFHNRFRDRIDFLFLGFDPARGFLGSFVNIGRSQAKGAELIGDVALPGGVHLRGNYSFLDSWTDDTERPLLRRPKHSGVIEAYWDWRRLTINSTTFFVGRREDRNFLAPELNAAGGYTRWDVAWSYRSAHRVTYFGVVENLLNRDYMEVLGFPALKLMFRAGARVDF